MSSQSLEECCVGLGCKSESVTMGRPHEPKHLGSFYLKSLKKGGGQTIETAEITNFCNLTRHHQELCAENDKATKTWETETSKQYGQFPNRPDSF